MTRHRFTAWMAYTTALLLLVLGAPPGAAEEAGAEFTPEQLVAKYGPAVVLIVGRDEAGNVKSLGSGFLVTPDGAIVTNYHVARGAYPATVKLTNGDIYDDISVIDYDSRRDLAILKIKGFNLPVVELGDSDQVVQGARVVVIGNPFGLENSVSDGLWSGARDTGAGYKLQQMTAPISPGNSGGPVFDTHGRVIGVATLSATQGQNLNFFVPINYARGLVGGKVKCSLKDLPEEKLGLEAATSSGPTTQVETLKLLIEAVTTYYRALDYSHEGESRSHEAWVWDRAPRDFVSAKVDVLLADSLALFDQAEEQAARAADGEGAAASLARRVVVSIAKVGKAHHDLVEVFIDPPLSYVALLQNCNAVSRAAQAEFEKQIEELPKLVAETAPDLAATLPSRFDPGTPLEAGDGFIGLMWPHVGLEAHVVYVYPKTPAERAGFQAGDVVLGVEGGPSFADRREVTQYVRSRPNQSFVLRVRRGKKEARLRVTPVPWVAEEWK